MLSIFCCNLHFLVKPIDDVFFDFHSVFFKQDLMPRPRVVFLREVLILLIELTVTYSAQAEPNIPTIPTKPDELEQPTKPSDHHSQKHDNKQQTGRQTFATLALLFTGLGALLGFSGKRKEN